MSINDFFICQSKIDELSNCGILISYLDSFADWLTKQYYPRSEICRHISQVAHFSYYLKGFPITSIESINDYIDKFLYNHLPHCQCKGWRQPKTSQHYSFSINRFKKYLSQCHGISFKYETFAYAEIHKKYLHWISEKRLLKIRSIESHSHYLKKFLNWYSNESGSKDLRELKAYDVENFFIKSMSRGSKSSKQLLQGTLRGFFDYCFEQRHIPRNLGYSLPTIRTYQLSTVPKSIKDAEAIKLLKSIDRSKEGGIRAYAIVQLLYTYGVRGGQIRALKLEDINWHQDKIYFSPLKGGKSGFFPLTVEVGNALIDYLQNVRKKSHHQEVFLTLKAPISALKTSKCLSMIVGAEMVKAHIQSPSLGTHCFRHGFVSRLLKQGESLKHIADLVGHRRIQTTFLYTKIDFNSLSTIALELPEVENENL